MQHTINTQLLEQIKHFLNTSKHPSGAFVTLLERAICDKTIEEQVDICIEIQANLDDLINSLTLHIKKN